MDGDSFVEMLCPYVDGELSVDERQELEAHLAECSACRDELDGLGSVVQQLRELPQLTAPASLFDSVRKGLDGGSARPARPGRAGVFLRRAFALAAGVLLALWVGMGPPATPPQGPHDRDQAELSLAEREHEDDRAEEPAGGAGAPGAAVDPGLEAPAEAKVEANDSDPDDVSLGAPAPPMPEPTMPADEGWPANEVRDGGAAGGRAPDVPADGMPVDSERAQGWRVDALIAELEATIEVGQSLLAEVSETEMPGLLSRLEQLPGVELDLKDLRARESEMGGGAARDAQAEKSDWLFEGERSRRARPGAAPLPGPEPQSPPEADESPVQRGMTFGATMSDSLDVMVAILQQDFAGDTVGLSSAEVRWLLRLLEIPSHDNRRQILFLWEPIDPGVGLRERAAAEAYTKQRLEALESLRE